MKKITISIFLFLATFAPAFAQKKIPVFVSDTEGYESYRIPAIITLPGGDLLAFCEGRVNGAGDFGDIDIVMKRSTDKGRTWGVIETVADAGVLQAGNPAPVVDLTDPAFPGGRIFLFYNTGNNHEGEVRKGKGLREVWYKTSVDGGLHWSEAINITLQVHRPDQPLVSPSYHFSEDWRSYANTPGHAMQFAANAYRGRIFVAANHSAGEPQERFADYRAHGYYTDDHGRSFHLSKDVDIPGGNENMAAELSGGRLMLNLRNQEGGTRTRIIAISSNGGASWDTAYFDSHLPDPVCQGSILTIDNRTEGNTIAFCNAADKKKRDNLTLRISFDEGRTWRRSYVVDKSDGSMKDEGIDYAAYSDIVRIAKKKIGVLYEQGNYKQILFTVVKWRY